MSFKVDVGTNRKDVCDFVLVIISNFSPILYRFSDTATYWLKMRIFLSPLSFNALARSESFEFLDELFIPKTRVLGHGQSFSEDFMILACVVLTQCQRVTDGQTDRQSDISAGLCVARCSDAL